MLNLPTNYKFVLVPESKEYTFYYMRINYTFPQSSWFSLCYVLYGCDIDELFTLNGREGKGNFSIN